LLPEYTCPPDYPWLQDADLAPGRRVPMGVEVDTPGEVDVEIGDESTDARHLVTGWHDGNNSAINWDTRDQVLQIAAELRTRVLTSAASSTCSTGPSSTIQSRSMIAIRSEAW
jgi:hypothetical protein